MKVCPACLVLFYNSWIWIQTLISILDIIKQFIFRDRGELLGKSSPLA